MYFRPKEFREIIILPSGLLADATPARVLVFCVFGCPQLGKKHRDYTFSGTVKDKLSLLYLKGTYTFYKTLHVSRQ
jgi:hypothetical protein